MIEKFKDSHFSQTLINQILSEFKNQNINLIYDKNISKTFDEIWSYFNSNNLLDSPEWIKFGENLIKTHKNSIN